MNKVRIIPIFNQVDVYAARLYTREAARQVGIELIDQARVSLATSSLAECLKMVDKQERITSDPTLGCSQITIRFLEYTQQSGIQIEFSCQDQGHNECIQQQPDKIGDLVDDIRVDQTPTGAFHVTLTKWGHSALNDDN